MIVVVLDASGEFRANINPHGKPLRLVHLAPQEGMRANCISDRSLNFTSEAMVGTLIKSYGKYHLTPLHLIRLPHNISGIVARFFRVPTFSLWGVPSYAPTFSPFLLPPTNLAASATASTMLDGSATPFPAIAKPVP